MQCFFQIKVEWQSTDPVAYQVTSHQPFLIELLVEQQYENFDICSYAVQPFICPKPQKIAYHIKQVDETMQSLKMGNCFLMNLLNLAVPAWEQVNCNLPIMQHVFCQMQNKEVYPAFLQTKPNPKSCLKGYIIHNNICYLFAWHKLGARIQQTCLSNKLQTFRIEQFLFKAVNDVFPPIFSPTLQYVVTYKQHWNTFSYKLNSAYKEKAGLYVCVRKQSEYFTSDYVFKCSDEIYISYMFICDGKKTVQVRCPVMK